MSAPAEMSQIVRFIQEIDQLKRVERMNRPLCQLQRGIGNPLG